MTTPNLRFRSKTTFNAHDSHLTTDDAGRTVINNGVKRRCELALNALLRKGASSISAITTHLQERFPDGGYTVTDIGTALLKLRSAGLVTLRGRGRGAKYRPSRDAVAKWRALPKENV